MKTSLFFISLFVSTRFLVAQPTSFSVTVTGKGQPIILIPGYSCSGNVWNETVAHLSDHYQCHVLTLAVFAGVVPIKTPILQTVRDEIIQYIKEKYLGKSILMEHSLGYTGDYPQAQDLAQETFVKVWQNVSTFKGESLVSTWLYRIAVTTCLNHLRTARKRPTDAAKVETIAVVIGQYVISDICFHYLDRLLH